MRAKPIAVTISNYPADASNDAEVIELENKATTTVHISKLGHKKVSPEPFNNNYVDDAYKKFKQQRNQKCLNVFLAISCIFSLAALGLVCALLYGFIEPRNSRKLNGCLCRGTVKGHTISNVLAENGKYSDLNDEVQELKNNSQNISETLVSMQGAFQHQAEDINEMTKKIDKWKTEIQQNMSQKMQQIVDDVDFSLEKFKNETFTQLLEMRKKLETMKISMKQNVSNLAEKLVNLQATSKKEFDNFKDNLMTNVTNSLQKIDKLSFVIEMFINETNKEMTETKNVTNSMLQRNGQQLEKINSSIWKKLSTMRGPRGYNGSQGIAGPPGPQGAQGKQGPRGLTIKECQNHTESHSVKFGQGTWDFSKITLKSTSFLYFNLKCETSQSGKAHGTKQGNSYKCQCMHKPGTLRDYKCILKYTRCTLISI